MELFDQGRHAFLENLIDHLPRTSNYRAAVASDEELATELLDGPDLPESTTPPLTEWSAEVEALAVVVDRLWEVCNTIAASVGGKPSQVKRYPRPVTAFDRVRARLREAEAARLESMLFPPERGSAS